MRASRKFYFFRAAVFFATSMVGNEIQKYDYKGIPNFYYEVEMKK
jgi:hypothetical protein